MVISWNCAQRENAALLLISDEEEEDSRRIEELQYDFETIANLKQEQKLKDSANQYEKLSNTRMVNQYEHGLNKPDVKLNKSTCVYSILNNEQTNLNDIVEKPRGKTRKLFIRYDLFIIPKWFILYCFHWTIWWKMNIIFVILVLILVGIDINIVEKISFNFHLFFLLTWVYLVKNYNVIFVFFMYDLVGIDTKIVEKTRFNFYSFWCFLPLSCSHGGIWLKTNVIFVMFMLCLLWIENFWIWKI